MSTSLHYEQKDKFWSDILWSGSTGYIISILVSMTLICNVSLQYVHSCKSKAKQPSSSASSPGGYILMITYQLSLIIAGIGTCIRTNVVWGLSLSEYNATRCMVGLIIVYFFSLCSYMLINIFYLYGIRSIFKGTRFAYSNWVYRSLLAWIITSISAIIIFTLTLARLSHKLQYYPGSKIAYCKYYRSEASEWKAFYAAGATLMTTEIVLLIMFLTRLNEVKKQMMVYHTIRKATETSNTSKTNTFAIDMDSEQEVNSPEKDKIRNLHNLMKKQTILVGIAIASTGCVWIGTFIYADFAVQSGWDNCINSICVWLMFDASNKYWEICKSKGICKCCYKDASD